jgi:ABC-type multidrug transport system ATPase subunit
MVAVMGPSGAGKSNLLDLIADRKSDGRWSGEISINGSQRPPWFPQMIAYVLQEDVFISELTVEETLNYAAWTRLPDSMSWEKKRERVTTMLEMMGLYKVKDSLVGNAMLKGISGGQKKRLSIAVELITLPELIFLDG